MAPKSRRVAASASEAVGSLATMCRSLWAAGYTSLPDLRYKMEESCLGSRFCGKRVSLEPFHS